MPTPLEDQFEGVEVQATGHGAFQAQVRTPGGSFLVDEPATAGGDGAGATPYDLLSAALAACTVMTLKLYAGRKGWPLAGARVRVLHRSGGLNAKDRFAREIELDGPLSGEQRRRLLEIAERCPVHQTLERGSEVISVLAEGPLPRTLGPVPTQHASDMAEACAE